MVIACNDVVKLLIDFLEHRLAPPEQQDMEAHFAACSECQEFLSDYNSTVALIRSLREEKVRIPEPVKARLREFLRRRQSIPVRRQ